MGKKGVNKMTLLGNVGNDPDIRYMPDEKCVANFTVATGDYWRDKATGEMRENTEWHRVVAFGKLAELVRDRIQKGTEIYLEGESKTRSFKANDGVTDIYRQEFILEGYGAVLQIIKNGKQRTPQQ